MLCRDVKHIVHLQGNNNKLVVFEFKSQSARHLGFSSKIKDENGYILERLMHA